MVNYPEMDDFVMPEELDDTEDENCDSRQFAETNRQTSILVDGVPSVTENSEECIGQIKELVGRYRQVENETREINDLAGQLAIGVHLQTELDKCFSQRRNFAIQIRLELRFLASGCSHLVITLQNVSDFVLRNWHIVIVITMLSTRLPNGCDALKSFSKSIAVERLAKDKEFICEVLCSERLIVPLLLRPMLVKRFRLHDNPRVFRLSLESTYFSLWNLITKSSGSVCLSSESSLERAVVYRRANEEQAFRLPSALVLLLCNEHQSENELLRWILPNVDVGDSNCCECFLREEPSKICSVRIDVRKNEIAYEVIIAARNPTLRAVLVSELQLRILVKMRYVYRELESKSGCEEILDGSSVSKYFNSFVNRFAS